MTRNGWLSALERLLVEEDGQDVVEYGLLIASIAVIVLMGVATFGALIQPWFARIANIITSTGA